MYCRLCDKIHILLIMECGFGKEVKIICSIIILLKTLVLNFVEASKTIMVVNA